MERYDRVYRLYRDFDTKTLRAYQDFVDLFPPVDSRVALDHWEQATDELERRKEEIRTEYPEFGDQYAEIAATMGRDQAFTALDLATAYGRSVNVLVLDVDETLRTAGRTDNEIPRAVLHRLNTLSAEDVPIVVCTGQTLENVKGILIQGLGNELVHSGSLSIVYESGNGVFTPGHGSATKRLLYDGLDGDITNVFADVRSRVLPDAPDELLDGCHLQGNEFNVTMKPNAETGSERARSIIDRALVYLVDLLADVVASRVDGGGADASRIEGDDVDTSRVDGCGADASRIDGDGVDGIDDTSQTPAAFARAFYSDDPEIRRVLDSLGKSPASSVTDVPEEFERIFDRIGIGYYDGDAAEIVSLELDKPTGVSAAFDVLGIDDPFALVMGDSKSDLRVMRWLDERNAGIAAAPEHASRDVLDHVIRTDELIFGEGDAASMLELVHGLNRFASLDV